MNTLLLECAGSWVSTINYRQGHRQMSVVADYLHLNTVIIKLKIPDSAQLFFA